MLPPPVLGQVPILQPALLGRVPILQPVLLGRALVLQPVLLGRVLGRVCAVQPEAGASWQAEPKTEPPGAPRSEHPTRLKINLTVPAETYPSLARQVWSATT